VRLLFAASIPAVIRGRDVPLWADAPKIRREVTTMRTVKRTRPMLTILAVLAVVMGIATASIQPVPAGEDNACSRGDRAPTCMHRL
jgi:hypothetical protein